MKKRILAAIMAICMALALLPTDALATDIVSDDNAEVSEDVNNPLLENADIMGMNEEAELATDQSETSGTCGANLRWEFADGTLTISGTGEMGVDSIPPWSQLNVKTAIIQEGVTSIGFNAFRECSKLTSVKIPSSVKIIGGQAFSHCNSLINIMLPDSITTIERAAFWGCTSLTSITLPKSVTSIGDCAFYECTNLTNITLPDSVETIEDYTFYKCSKLMSMKIPDSVKTIETRAFSGCASLTDIILPNSVGVIESGAFAECISLESITIPGSVKFCDGLVKEGVFYRCTNLTAVTILDGVTYINKEIFKYCSSLTSITLPDSIEYIGDYAFSYCGNLSNIEIPRSVVSIGKGAFDECESLTSIEMPSGVPSIEDFTFWGCGNLSNIEIPRSVTSIGFAAFVDCESLSDIYYAGSEDEWGNISIDKESNECLTNATIHYNSTGIGMGSGGGEEPVKPPVKPPVEPPTDVTDTSLQQFNGVYYYDTIARTGVNVDLLWSWNYLLTWGSEIYNQSLAKMGVVLSASIEGSTDEAAKILINNLGCDKAVFYETSPGALFAHRTIKKADGNIEHIIFIVVRGTTSGIDVANDILSAMNKGDWGFNDMYSILRSKLSEWSNSYGEINASNTKFFVTGHSLGGACANLISAQLSETYGKNNVFGYTYAAPSPFAEELSENNYRNIHNFLCYNDNVPSRLSLQGSWYGNGYHTWFYPGNSSQIATNYTTLTGKSWLDTYKENKLLRLHAPSAYMAFLMTNLNLNKVEATVSYIRVKCPVDVEIYNSSNELVGHIVNDEVDYDNYTSDVMLTVTDGAKCVYFLNDDTYTIKFIGTGDGTMAYTVASKDMNSDTIEETKVYSNIIISDGKQLKSIVSSYNESNTDILVGIPNVELLVVDDEGNAVARVLSDSEAATTGKGSGAEVPVSSDNPNNKPGNQPDNNQPASSDSSTTVKKTWTWKPTTPDEKKRFACVGGEIVEYTMQKGSAYPLEIRNSVQGPKCFVSFEAVLGGYTIGRTYNIYPDRNKTYGMDKEVQFTMTIPKSIYKVGREYKMVCVTENGLPVIYEDLDDDPKTITIKTNKFYAYALIYK